MLDFMARTGKRPSELLADLYAKVGPHYDRLDLSLKPEDRDQVWKKAEDARPDTIAGIKVTARDTTDGFRFTLGDKGWRCCASRARSRWSASTPKSLATSRWCRRSSPMDASLSVLDPVYLTTGDSRGLTCLNLARTLREMPRSSNALSLDEVRRIVIRAQGLAVTPDRPKTVRDVLRRTGAVQLDTISVLARSHELVAYARLGPVQRARGGVLVRPGDGLRVLRPRELRDSDRGLAVVSLPARTAGGGPCRSS